jgi:riboflavin synthase
MFTGIVEEVGRLVAVDAGPGATRMTIAAPAVCAELAAGQSVAVNGVCLTVTGVEKAAFRIDLIGETLARSSLGQLAAGASVNLERAVPLGGRLGGHLVQGHVDGVGRLTDRRPGDRGELLRVAIPEQLARYVVEKGSIALDGVSLTVAAVEGSAVTVALIPTTLAATTLGDLPVGAAVNVEVDVVAKYVERLLAATAGSRP